MFRQFLEVGEITTEDYATAVTWIEEGKADLILNAPNDVGELDLHGLEATAPYLTIYCTAVTATKRSGRTRRWLSIPAM